MSKFKTFLLVLNLIFIIGLSLYVIIRSEVIFLNPCEECEERYSYSCSRIELGSDYLNMFDEMVKGNTTWDLKPS